MAIAEVTQKIISDAENAAEAIKERARREASEILEEGRNEEAALRETLAERLEKSLSEEVRRARAGARLAAHKRKNAVKRELINKVFDSILKESADAECEEYKNLLANVFTNVSTKQGVVFAPSRREKETDAVLKSAGFSGDIKYNDEIGAGCIVESGREVYDLRFSRIVDEAREALEIDVHNILFDEK